MVSSLRLEILKVTRKLCKRCSTNRTWHHRCVSTALNGFSCTRLKPAPKALQKQPLLHVTEPHEIWFAYFRAFSHPYSGGVAVLRSGTSSGLLQQCDLSRRFAVT